MCKALPGWSCRFDSAARSPADRSHVMPQDPGMAMTLTGYRAPPTAPTLTGPSGPDRTAPRMRRGPSAACAAWPDARAPLGLPPDGVAIQTWGPLAAGPGHRGGPDAVKLRDCATAQGSNEGPRPGGLPPGRGRSSAAYGARCPPSGRASWPPAASRLGASAVSGLLRADSGQWSPASPFTAILSTWPAPAAGGPAKPLTETYRLPSGPTVIPVGKFSPLAMSVRWLPLILTI